MPTILSNLHLNGLPDEVAQQIRQLIETFGPDAVSIKKVLVLDTLGCVTTPDGHRQVRRLMRAAAAQQDDVLMLEQSTWEQLTRREVNHGLRN